MLLIDRRPGVNRHQVAFPTAVAPGVGILCHLRPPRCHSLEGVPVGIARAGRQDGGPRPMMTITPRAEPAPDSDPDLWQLVCQGSASAFEVLVRRYQSRVCAVAYSACGDLALSEDVAQETFWTAWRQRATLEQPSQLGSWLCGIARNLGKNARRRAARPAE